MSDNTEAPTEQTRADQILEAFIGFHTRNPSVWELFKKFTWQAIGAGRDRYSADAICHRIRWHTDIETHGEEIKINNNYTAYYARLFHAAHPEHAGFFQNRLRISEKHDATGDGMVFIAPQPGEEIELRSRLREILQQNPPR